jgi:hypothetical protein
VLPGSYVCWANGQARPLLNFTVRGPRDYTGSDGRPGVFSHNPGTQRIVFQSGALQNVLPTGFYNIYYEPGGRPTVSMRNAGGSEVSFCQKQ